MHKTVIKGKYKVNRDDRVILIVEHKEDGIQWACSKYIFTESGESESLKEVMTISNGNLWKMSAILEFNNFCKERNGFGQREASLKKNIEIQYL